MSSGRESPRQALSRRAESDPESPFLFFRSPRGTFAWWSFRRAAEALDQSAPPAGAVLEAARVELLDAIRDATSEEIEQARALSAVVGDPARAEREIWISTRPLARREERCLLLAGTLAGWAIVREASEGPAAALALWARPTLLSDDEAELVALCGAMAGEAPRWRRQRWLERHLARLRIVLVEGGGSVEAVASELVRLAALEERARHRRRVLSFPRAGW